MRFALLLAILLFASAAIAQIGGLQGPINLVPRGGGGGGGGGGGCVGAADFSDGCAIAIFGH